jgi:hypothetical protein
MACLWEKCILGWADFPKAISELHGHPRTVRLVLFYARSYCGLVDPSCSLGIERVRRKRLVSWWAGDPPSQPIENGASAAERDDDDVAAHSVDLCGAVVEHHVAIEAHPLPSVRHNDDAPSGEVVKSDAVGGIDEVNIAYYLTMKVLV